ncbi:MAG: polymerase IV-like protein ImuB [Myxococcaceae bacterium]|nr:polymerase IV-like protein ImuB [Myxococcaceae bacterium]
MRLGYLHFPRFPVQRRVRETPSLSGRPLVLWADERGVQRVSFASSTALKAGVRPGQTVASAGALVPGLHRLPYSPLDEAQALASLGEALMVLTPGFQIDSPEGLWVDASAAPLEGGEGPWLEAVLAFCQQLGWVGRGVIGSERFTVQALARFSTQPASVVEPHGGARLSPLPLQALARALGPGGVEPLAGLGLTTLGEVAALPAGAVSARFGHEGTLAAQLARGADDSLFTPDPLPEVLHEAIALDWPAEALEPLLFALKSAVDRLCARLQGRKLAAVRLTVRLDLERVESSRGANPSVALILARPSAQARLLVELIRHRLTDLTVRRPICALSVTIDEACADDGRQLNLGDAPEGEAALEVVLSRLQSALGEEALFGAELVDTHRPEAAWKEKRFALSAAPERSLGWWESAQRPPVGSSLDCARDERGGPGQQRGLGEQSGLDEPGAEPRSPREKSRDGDSESRLDRPSTSLGMNGGTLAASQLLERPARLLREPAPLPAELTPEGALLSLSLLGRKRRVTALFGPERLAGEWWTEQPYARDYYRVVLEGVGPLWIFRDGRDGRFYAQGVFD